jgi:tRNA pseudouridine38-40 synthase
VSVLYFVLCETSPATDMVIRFNAWLRFIDEYDGPEFKYLGPSGEVPPEAIIHRGQRKRGSTDKFREYLWKNPAGKGLAGAQSSEDEESDGKKPDVEMEG